MSVTITASNINNPNDTFQLPSDDVKKNYYIIKPYYPDNTYPMTTVDTEKMQQYISGKTHS